MNSEYYQKLQEEALRQVAVTALKEHEAAVRQSKNFAVFEREIDAAIEKKETSQTMEELNNSLT